MASEKFGLEKLIACSICLELFNEDLRCPRVLFCGHTFCYSCLDKILKHSLSCPTCKTAVNIESIELIPVNFIVKSMISIVKKANENESQNYSLPVVNLNSNAGKLESEGYCSDHSNFKELRCMDCESWICGMCAVLHHRHCRTLLVKEAYKELKMHVSDKAKIKLKTMISLSLEITESLKKFNNQRKDFIEEIKKEEKELKYTEKNMEELETQNSEGNKFCEKLKILKSLIETSTDDSEFLKLINEMDDLLEKGNTLIAKIKSLETTYARTIKSLQQLCEKQSICVVDMEDEPLYGMVKVKYNCVWISSFQTKKPEARLFPFQSFLSNFGISSELPTKAFLQLTPEGGRNDHIEIVIETDGDSARGKNFILLCSALKGQKYKGRTLYPEKLSFKLIDGPPPVVEGINESDFKVPCKIGSVTGIMKAESSCFELSLDDDPDLSGWNIGLIVVELQKLLELHGKELTITDCGLIIG